MGPRFLKQSLKRLCKNTFKSKQGGGGINRPPS